MRALRVCANAQASTAWLRAVRGVKSKAAAEACALAASDDAIAAALERIDALMHQRAAGDLPLERSARALLADVHRRHTDVLCQSHTTRA